MSDLCKISFPETDYPPINLPHHQNLSEHLTIQNSPVLFGCRTGICYKIHLYCLVVGLVFVELA